VGATGLRVNLPAQPARALAMRARSTECVASRLGRVLQRMSSSLLGEGFHRAMRPGFSTDSPPALGVAALARRYNVDRLPFLPGARCARTAPLLSELSVSALSSTFPSAKRSASRSTGISAPLTSSAIVWRGR